METKLKHSSTHWPPPLCQTTSWPGSCSIHLHPSYRSVSGRPQTNTSCRSAHEGNDHPWPQGGGGVCQLDSTVMSFACWPQCLGTRTPAARLHHVRYIVVGLKFVARTSEWVAPSCQLDRPGCPQHDSLAVAAAAASHHRHAGGSLRPVLWELPYTVTHGDEP